MSDQPALLAELHHGGLAEQPIDAVDGPRVRIAGEWVLNFAATNYLGLSRHPWVAGAAARAAHEWGISLASPRVLAVDRLTQQLELALARLDGQEQALILPSTTHAAQDVLPLLAGPRGALFLDAWAYPLSAAGAYAATRRGAHVHRFAHDDARALAGMLEAHGASGGVEVSDGVYQATGRTAALRAIERAARDWGAQVYVDDAHGIGLLGAHADSSMPYGYGGAGTPAHLAIAPGRIIHVGSLSKALGLPVAFVAGPAGPILRLRAAAPAYTHCSPPALPVLAAALAALQAHERHGDALRQRLAGLVRRFQHGLIRLGLAPRPRALFPIQTLLFSSPGAAHAAARALRRRGILAVLQIGSNEHSGAALRFALTALHTPADIDRLLEALARNGPASAIRMAFIPHRPPSVSQARIKYMLI
jgi:8-amino-7-oxononanoate synthase